jgi:hypothetical protein
LEEALRPRREGDFFENVRARRIKLSSDAPDTSELLHQARTRRGE